MTTTARKRASIRIALTYRDIMAIVRAAMVTAVAVTWYIPRTAKTRRVHSAAKTIFKLTGFDGKSTSGSRRQ